MQSLSPAAKMSQELVHVQTNTTFASVIIGSISLFSMLMSFAAISCGIQLLTTGKVFNFNPLTLQQRIRK